jgi:hypothetical protein
VPGQNGQTAKPSLYFDMKAKYIEYSARSAEPEIKAARELMLHPLHKVAP